MAATRRNRPQRNRLMGITFEKSTAQIRAEESWSDGWRNLVGVMRDMGYNMYPSLIAQSPKIIIMKGRDVVAQHDLGEDALIPAGEKIASQYLNSQ